MYGTLILSDTLEYNTIRVPTHFLIKTKIKDKKKKSVAPTNESFQMLETGNN